MNKQIKKTLVYGFVSMMVFNIAHPVTPALIQEKFNDFSMFGNMFAAMATGSFISARYWGKIWDKFHSKYILLIPLATAYPLSQFLMAIANSKTQILIARFIAGASGAAVYFVVIPAIISELSTAFNRSQNQLYYSINAGIAAQTGYLLGGFLGKTFGPTFTIQIQSLIGFLMFLPGIYLISNGIKHKSNFGKVELISDIPNPVFEVDCDCNIFWTHKLYHFLFILTPIFILLSPLSKFYDVSLASNGFGTNQIGILGMLNGFVSLVFSLLVGRRLMKKYDEINLLALASFILMFGLLIIGLTRNINILLLIFPIWFATQTLSRSLISATVSNRFKTHPGEAMGLRKKFHDFGNISGALILGWIFTKFNWGIYLFGGIILIPTTILMIVYRKHLIEHLGGQHWW